MVNKLHRIMWRVCEYTLHVSAAQKNETHGLKMRANERDHGGLGTLLLRKTGQYVLYLEQCLELYCPVLAHAYSHVSCPSSPVTNMLEHHHTKHARSGLPLHRLAGVITWLQNVPT